MSDLNEPLGLTVHSMPSPEQCLARERTARGRLKMLGVLLVCAAPVVASYFTYFVIRPEGAQSAYGALIQPTVSMPDIAARALDGQPRPLRALKGQWLLVVVNSGNCDAGCESRLYMQRQLREMTGRDRDRIDKVWLMTDDAPLEPALRTALEAAPAMHILRAQRRDVETWLRPAPGHALDEHLYLIDPMGEWMMRMPAQADPSKVKRDLERLLRASASWDRAGR